MSFLARQYQRTMADAYAFARAAIRPQAGMRVLDCGCGSGHEWQETFAGGAIPGITYTGLEWNADVAAAGRGAGLNIVQADLNARLPLADASQDRIIALSVVEHLLKPCAFLRESHRVLAPGGILVVLTPNISTYFTALQVLAGRMPSSGPHPDSNWLLQDELGPTLSGRERDDITADTPQHRHLVVFSFSTLRRLLVRLGFGITSARAFGWYPLPIPLQRIVERVDPWHSHQMVFECRKEQERA